MKLATISCEPYARDGNGCQRLNSPSAGPGRGACGAVRAPAGLPSTWSFPARDLRFASHAPTSGVNVSPLPMTTCRADRSVCGSGAVAGQRCATGGGGAWHVGCRGWKQLALRRTWHGCWEPREQRQLASETARASAAHAGVRRQWAHARRLMAKRVRRCQNPKPLTCPRYQSAWCSILRGRVDGKRLCRAAGAGVKILRTARTRRHRNAISGPNSWVSYAIPLSVGTQQTLGARSATCLRSLAP